jgi:hypothetical protein
VGGKRESCTVLRVEVTAPTPAQAYFQIPKDISMAQPAGADPVQRVAITAAGQCTRSFREH